MLTFYADVQLAMRQPGLVRAGDHAYVTYGKSNSWANGKRTIFGQDSVDFNLTLSAVDQKKGIAILTVRHVATAQSRLNFPAEWMHDDFSRSAPINN